MRVLVTGAGGQLGAAISQRLSTAGVDVVSVTSSEMDITDPDHVRYGIGLWQPDVVVNGAAYTEVDAAEADETQAFLVNADGVGNLATACDLADAMLVHLSTDYVFDGAKDGWYIETDEATPISAYGRSKLAGEQQARRAERSLVLRTSWLLGASSNNFITKILQVGAERGELNVVDDQLGCPTAVNDLADAIVELLDRIDVGPGEEASEVHDLYHLASAEAATWYELAMAVRGCSASIADVPCHPIASDEFPSAAKRPANSRLDSSKIADLKIVIPSWRLALPAIVEESERACLTN